MRKHILFVVLVLCITINIYAEWMWQELEVPTTVNQYQLREFAISNKNTVWALGFHTDHAVIFVWDTQKKIWLEHSKQLPNVIDIAASNDKVLFALQKNLDHASLYGWNGTSWQELYNLESTTVSSVAAINKDQVYAVLNEKAYALTHQTWKQLGSLEGFREIAAAHDGTIYARRFDFKTALNPETAFPAFSLQIVQWNGYDWYQLPIRTEREKAVMSIALSNKDNVYCIIREDMAGGSAHTWNASTNRLEPMGNRMDLYTVTAAADGTVWALSWHPQPAERKLYEWVNKISELPPSKLVEPITTPSPQPTIVVPSLIPAPAPAATKSLVSAPLSPSKQSQQMPLPTPVIEPAREVGVSVLPITPPVSAPKPSAPASIPTITPAGVQPTSTEVKPNEVLPLVGQSLQSNETKPDIVEQKIIVKSEEPK